MNTKDIEEFIKLRLKENLKLMQADGKSCQVSREIRFAAGARPVQVTLPACE